MDSTHWLACAAITLAACAEKRESLEEKCRGGDALACEQACDKGAAGDGGCLGLAEARLAAQTLAEAKGDASEAAGLASQTADAYRKACERGDAGACLSGASALERRLERRPAAAPVEDGGAPGEGFSKSPLAGAELALRNSLFAKACELGSAGGCERLAGAKLGKDEAGAVTAFERACKAGTQKKLFGLEGECLDVRKRIAQRASASRKACSEGRPRECRRLGQLLAPLDPARAVEAFVEEALLRGPELYPEGVQAHAIAELSRQGSLPSSSPPPGSPWGRDDSADFGAIGLHGAAGGGAQASPMAPDPGGEPPPPLPEAKFRPVRLGALTISGRVDQKAVEKVLEENLGRLWKCYEARLAVDPNLQGRVSVRFVIDRTGEAFHAGNGGSDLPSSEVVSCVVRAMGALRFPRPEAGVVTVVSPFLFSPPRR